MNIPHDPDQILAVVDENDKVIGQCRRSERENHAEGKLHRETCVLIVNPKEEILIQTRRDSGKLDFSAAGHFPFNEGYLQGAQREVEEELGMKIPADQFELIAKPRLTYKDEEFFNDRFSALFVVKSDYKLSDFKIDPAEVILVNYYTPDSLKKILQDHPDCLAYGLLKSLPLYFN
jgi:isopentenyldiphosphate isomerase